MTYSEYEKFLMKWSGPATASILLTKTVVQALRSTWRKESGAATPVEPVGVLTVSCEVCGSVTQHLIQTFQQ